MLVFLTYSMIFSRHVLTYLGEVHAERAHVQSVEEAAEAFVEAVEALVQVLQVHEVGF